MASNEILPFGATASNELTQAAYAADAQRLTGHQPGVARSALMNKTLHQVSVIAAGVAQFLADRQATNIVDTLTPAQVAALFATANAGRLARIVKYDTASGVFAYAKGANTKFILIRGVAGGGAGGGCPTGGGTASAGAGGASGAYAEILIDASVLASSVNVTVGAGGTSLVNSQGNPGGATIVPGVMTLNGGTGGGVGVNYANLGISGISTSGGTATGTGLFKIDGVPGDVGLVFGGVTGGRSGIGASTPLGAGGNPASANGTVALAGNPGGGYGAGGSGGLGVNNGATVGGGAGARGCLIFEEYE